MNLKERVKGLKANIPAVFFALKDSNTPFIARILAGITVGYALSPIDLIPDFIPVLGYLDDIIILPALVALTIKCISNDVWEKSKEKSIGLWNDKNPKRWFCSLPIIALWALIIWAIIKAVIA